MIVGFHAQQAIEKLIKAVLSDRQIAFPRVNDLGRLVELIEAEQITPPPGARQLGRLTPWATRLRYEDPAEPIDLNRPATLALVNDIADWASTQLAR